jgi:hypothetical protein
MVVATAKNYVAELEGAGLAITSLREQFLMKWTKII